MTCFLPFSTCLRPNPCFVNHMPWISTVWAVSYITHNSFNRPSPFGLVINLYIIEHIHIVVDLFKVISGMLVKHFFVIWYHPKRKQDYVIPFYPPSRQPLYFVAYMCLCIYLLLWAYNETLGEILSQGSYSNRTRETHVRSQLVWAIFNHIDLLLMLISSQ